MSSNPTTNWVKAMTQNVYKKSVSLKNISCLKWQSNQNEFNPLIKAFQIRNKFICIKAWVPFSLLRPGFFTSTSCKCVVKLIWDKRTSPCSTFTWLNSYKECSLTRSRCLIEGKKSWCTFRYISLNCSLSTAPQAPTHESLCIWGCQKFFFFPWKPKMHLDYHSLWAPTLKTYISSG